MLFQVTSEDRMIKDYVKEFERLMNLKFQACSKAAGTVVEQSFNIMDIKGVGLGMLTGKVKAFMKMTSSIAQDYYPETLGKMFVINASTVFSLIFSIVKGFIDEKTQKKISVLKSDYQDKLLEFIDKQNLPTIFGGSCTCSHIEGGCLFSDIGPWNPRGGIIQ